MSGGLWADAPGAVGILVFVTVAAAGIGVAALIWLAMKRADAANLRRFPPPVVSAAMHRKMAERRAAIDAQIEAGRLPGDILGDDEGRA